MTKKRRTPDPPQPSPRAIVAELEKLFHANLGWALVNTKEQEVKVNALPKEQLDTIKEEIGLKPHRLTPEERMRIKKEKARAARSRKS